MKRTFCFVLITILLKCVGGCCNEEKEEDYGIRDNDIRSIIQDLKKGSATTPTWEEAFSMYPTEATWTVQTSIPVSSDETVTDIEDSMRQARGRKRGGMKKKMKKYMMPLLIAYKLKFFTLIPVLIGGLILLTGATGLAGFFFALFAAVMGLKTGGHDHH